MINFEEFTKEKSDKWLQEFLDKYDLEAIERKMHDTLLYRSQNPDWERPVIMYGIRKLNNFIKKQEIGVILDKSPWQDRARMAETHWYHILYKRPATDLEWQEASGNRRYIVWKYFLNDCWTVDKIISHIARDDSEEYGVDPGDMISAFEAYFKRKIRVYWYSDAV